MSSLPLYKITNINEKLQPILKEMSDYGIQLNKIELEEIGRQIDKELSKVKSEIYKCIDIKINLNSSSQLADLLFIKLGLPVGKKNKKGYSTDENTLKKLKLLHPVIPLLLKHRTISKIKSTYINSLIEEIQSDNKIHSTFLTDVAITGRIVSRQPNLQNIPIKSEWGEKIRHAFIPDEGFIFLSGDYSQIELRLLAHLSKEEKLITAFNNNEDIHRITASEIFSKPLSHVTDKDRRVAKTVNFSIIYGISAHGLSETLEIGENQAAYFIKTYLSKYPKINAFINNIKNQAKKNSFVETLGGEKKYIKELSSTNFHVRKTGERMAVNYPIQGSAAEIIKLSMVKIDQDIKGKKLQSKLVMQIHDELLYAVSIDEEEIMNKIIKKGMENIVKLSIPITVTIKKGSNWGELREIV